MAEVYCLDSSGETDCITKFSSDFQGQSFQKFKIKNGENALTWLIMVKSFHRRLKKYSTIWVSKLKWSTFIVKWGASS